jgi:biopolymer transport protein ExbD
MSLRRQRRGRAEKSASLNLVSLMDIFTILVFFLMVNASEVEILETSTAIKLPDSTSEHDPDERVSIEVSNDELLLQGQVIAQVSDILARDEVMIEELVSELARQPLNEDIGKVTIMGDKALPYELLKRVMVSCQTANYRQIALAVNQVSTVSGEEAS